MLFRTFQTRRKRMIDMCFYPSFRNGRMAQWLRHPPTERGIPGSNPGVIGIFFFRLSYTKNRSSSLETYSVF